MKTLNVNIFGILPGGEVTLSMGLRNVFSEIKKDLDKMLSEKEEQEESAEVIICYIPSSRSDNAIFVMLDAETNFPIERLLKNTNLKEIIQNHFDKVTKTKVKFGRRFSHWYEWEEPKIDPSVHIGD